MIFTPAEIAVVGVISICDLVREYYPNKKETCIDFGTAVSDKMQEMMDKEQHRISSIQEKDFELSVEEEAIKRLKKQIKDLKKEFDEIKGYAKSLMGFIPKAQEVLLQKVESYYRNHSCIAYSTSNRWLYIFIAPLLFVDLFFALFVFVAIVDFTNKDFPQSIMLSVALFTVTSFIVKWLCRVAKKTNYEISIEEAKLKIIEINQMLSDAHKEVTHINAMPFQIEMEIIPDYGLLGDIFKGLKESTVKSKAIPALLKIQFASYLYLLIKKDEAGCLKISDSNFEMLIRG